MTTAEQLKQIESLVDRLIAEVQELRASQTNNNNGFTHTDNCANVIIYSEKHPNEGDI